MIVQTADLTPDSLPEANTRLQTYCGLDCCVTLEVFQALHNNTVPAIYSFERALQAPYLEIMLRGFAVDSSARWDAAQALRRKREVLERQLNRLAYPVWDKLLNPRSPAQLKEFFYKSMHLPEVWISKKGERKLSTDREALEKLYEHMHARPFVSLILAIRDIGKQLDVFESEIDQDQRYRTSYNIAGTECIAGDSLVWTKGGLRRIDEIFRTSHAVQIWNGTRFVTPVKKVCYANKPGKRITLEGGYSICCTLNHELMTTRGWQRADEIRNWDLIEINPGLTELFGQHALPRGGLLEQLSEDFCELFGMALADGSLNVNSEHKRLRLSNSNAAIRERFLWLAKQAFNVTGGESGDEAYFSSVPVCIWLRDFGFIADGGLGTATRKTIPAALMRAKPNLLRALLRGLTLDSHVTEKGLMFGTQSPEMQEQIQQILLILGICSVKLSVGDGIKLNVPRAYCGRFISIIGFVSQHKMFELARILNERCQWHEPRAFGHPSFVKIVSIEDWQGDVYDLTMPADSPPQYVANGFTSHNTGRPSSSENAFGTGGNAQNIASALRFVFVADPGYRLCVIDLEQVEARDVGFFEGCLFDDWAFLDSCESGDLHTNNAKLVWPELPWTGNPKGDKALAEYKFYRDFSYRDMAKRGGHLSNYYGTAWTMARSLKIPEKLAVDFQKRYCRGATCAYPAHQLWWQWTAKQLQTTRKLVTPFGRERMFFGRPNDDTTLREAIAFLPQSTTADRMNLALWRTWKKEPLAQLLAQTYDSITFQVPDDSRADDIIGRVLHDHIPVELWSACGRRYVVPGEAKVGYNWGYRGRDGSNPDGLRLWQPGATMCRQARSAAEMTFTNEVAL